MVYTVYITLYHTILSYIYTIPHYTTLYHTIPLYLYTIPHYTTLHYTTLYHTIYTLYPTIPHYTHYTGKKSPSGPTLKESPPAWLLPKSPMESVFRSGYTHYTHYTLIHTIHTIPHYTHYTHYTTLYTLYTLYHTISHYIHYRKGYGGLGNPDLADTIKTSTPTLYQTILSYIYTIPHYTTLNHTIHTIHTIPHYITLYTL